MDEDIESTAVEMTGELVPSQPYQPSTNLFHTDDPVEVVAKASRVAGALKDVLDRQGMIQNIKGRAHVRVEGWTTLGAMLGVVPIVTWTRKIDRGWEARVEARTLDGRVIGAAESQCSKDEGKPWSDRDDYALRSMAQTRATSKALAGPLRFVVTLAGYEGTPAEEMPSEGSQMGPGVASDAPTEPQLKYLKQLRNRAKLNDDERRALLKSVGAEEGQQLTRGQVSQLIEILKEGPVPTGTTDVPEPAEGEFQHPEPPQDETLPFE